MSAAALSRRATPTPHPEEREDTKTWADLILAWADAPPHDLSVSNAVAELPDERLEVIYELLTGERPDETDSPGWRDEARGRLRQALDELDMVRDVATIDVHGYSILVGGGTSWGDCPEGWDSVAIIAASGNRPEPSSHR